MSSKDEWERGEVDFLFGARSYPNNGRGDPLASGKTKEHYIKRREIMFTFLIREKSFSGEWKFDYHLRPSHFVSDFAVSQDFK